MYVILGTYVVGLIPATSPPERDDEKNCPPSTHSRNVLRFTDLWNAIKNYRWQHRHQQPPPHHDAQIAESSLKSTLNWVLQKIMRTTYFFGHYYAAAHFTLWGKHKNCPISLNCQWSNNELWCLLIFDLKWNYLLFGTIFDFIYPIMTTQLEGMKEKEGADTVQSRWVDSSLQLCRKLHQQISLRNHSGCFANTYWGTHPSSQLALSLLGNKIWFL